MIGHNKVKVNVNFNLSSEIKKKKKIFRETAGTLRFEKHINPFGHVVWVFFRSAGGVL